MTGIQLFDNDRDHAGDLRFANDRSPVLLGMLMFLFISSWSCGQRGDRAGQIQAKEHGQAQDTGQGSSRDQHQALAGGSGQGQSQEGSFAGDSVRDHAGIGDSAGILYSSGTAVLKAVRLPDGTEIVMHAGSRARISKTFNVKDRELWIEGEAMLDITGETGKPFVLHTRNLKILVLRSGLGTRFRVDAKAGQAGEEADVLSGRIKVMKSYHSDTDNEPELIGAGEMVMINRDIDLMEKEKMDGSELKGWDAVH